jgi:EAL domain-containing protein (putative c-di-GMP-specific phosphodiesterase class I)
MPPAVTIVERLIEDPAAIVPVFQPIVSLIEGRIVGYEALARFPTTPVGGPRIAIDEARQLGRDAELEAAAARRAIEIAIAARLPAGAFLSVNVSPRLLPHPLLWAALRSSLGEQLVIELTEDESVEDYRELRRSIRRYQGHGVRFAIDDTGAGFASLRHVSELWPAFVKLDALSSRRLGRDRRRQAMVRALSDMASEVGATLVVEGVERTDDLAHLARAGLPVLVQGYAVAEPAAPWATIRDDAARVMHGQPVPQRPAPSVVSVESGAERPMPGIEQAVNVGAVLASALRSIGLETIESLRTLGALPAWERLRDERPSVATSRTLLALEGAVRGVRWWQLPQAEQGRLLEIAGGRPARGSASPSIAAVARSRGRLRR